MTIELIIILGVFLLLIIIGLAIVNFSYDEFKRLYEEYNMHSSGYTSTSDLVSFMSKKLHRKINIKLTNIPHSENYNASTNTITLSTEVANSYSISALTITAHELGHAEQCTYQTERMRRYFKRARWSGLLGKLFFPLLLAFVLTFALISPELQIYSFAILGFAGLCLFASLSLKISTIKIEKEASENALKILEEYADFNSEQLKCSKKLLNSAKNTYLADFLKVLLKWTMMTRR